MVNRWVEAGEEVSLVDPFDEGDNGSTDLDGDLLLRHGVWVLDEHQRPKLGVVIEDPELIVLVFDIGVEARDGDVGDARLALMTSTLGDEIGLRAACSYEFKQLVIRVEFQDVEALLVSLRRLGRAFKHDIGPLRPLHLNELDAFLRLLDDDLLGKWALADLALELLPGDHQG